MIGTGTLTKEIAAYLARTDYSALNDDALRATKEHILYTLGTILAGSSAPGIKQALAGAKALHGAQRQLHRSGHRRYNAGGGRGAGQCDHGP